MDLTPFLATSEQGTQDEGLESIQIPGRIAVVAKGRFLLRALCRSFGAYSRITCAVTDQQACLDYLAAEADDPYSLLICTDYLESGNGFDLVQKAREGHPHLHAVMLALGDAIPAECAEAPGLRPWWPKLILWRISNPSRLLSWPCWAAIPTAALPCEREPCRT